MKSRFASISAALVLFCGACASAGAGTGAAGITPPTLLNPSSHPDFNLVASRYDTSVRLDLQVWVDAQGKPEIDSFRLTGNGADRYNDSFKQWIASMQFHPARQN